MNLTIEKVLKFHYFTLCVRMRIDQIGTPLEILPNRYIFPHYNTTDCLFIYMCVRPKSIKSVHILKF